MITKVDLHLRIKMTINKITQDDLRRYTFVTKVEFKNMYVYVHYKHNDEIKVKKISYRATGLQLQKFIEKIKVEIGYIEIKKQRDILIRKEINKPMIFGNVGE